MEGVQRILYNEVLFSHKKKSSNDTCYNMDKSGNFFLKENIFSERR